MSTAALYLWTAVALTIVHAVVVARTVDHFSPDSWSYFELSKSVFADFLRAATVRQYQFDPPYATSFPPLLPVLMACWNAVFHSGIYASTFVNAIVAIATYPVLVTLGRRLSDSDVPGMLAAVALVGNPWYLEEVMAGRAIPLAVLLMLVLLHLIARIAIAPAMAIGTAAAAGVVAGLAFETRFDFLLPAVAVGAGLGVLLWRRGGVNAAAAVAAYYVGLTAGLTPWIVYSLAHFHVPLVSDNGRTAIMASTPFVLRFLPYPNLEPTLWTAPLKWLFHKTYVDARNTLTALATAVAASPVLALAVGHLSLLWARVSRASRAPARGVLALAWLAIAIQVALICLTGYIDLRYWIGLSLVAVLSCAVGIVRGVRAIDEDATLQATFVASSPLLLLPAQLGVLANIHHHADSLTGPFTFVWPMVVIVLLAFGPLVRSGRVARVVALGPVLALLMPLAAIAAGAALARDTKMGGYTLTGDPTAATAAATQTLVDGLDGDDPAKARVLVAAVGGAPMICEFGARTGIFNVLKPTPPFGWIDLLLLVRKYHITHAIAGDRELDARLPVLFEVHRSRNGALWHIDGERRGLVERDVFQGGSILGLDTMDLVRNTLGPGDAMRRDVQQDRGYPLVFVPRR